MRPLLFRGLGGRMWSVAAGAEARGAVFARAGGACAAAAVRAGVDVSAGQALEYATKIDRLMHAPEVARDLGKARVDFACFPSLPGNVGCSGEESSHGLSGAPLDTSGAGAPVLRR